MAAYDCDALDKTVGEAINITLSGKYERKHAVGRGAYGQMWLVTRLKDQVNCIATVISIDKMPLYEQDVQCHARCSHFNLVRLVDTFQSTIGPIIILELADAGDLAYYLKDFMASKRGALLDEENVGRIFVQLVLAIHHLHTNRMMHRGINTSNVLMCTDGIVKVSDFGLSRHLHEQDVANAFLGTHYYFAPELWKRQKYSKKTDMWSLGIVLYELMTLKRPFVMSSMRGLMNAILAGDVEKPDDKYSEGLREVLAAMLHVDPARRPSTADVLARPVMRAFVQKFQDDIVANPKIRETEKPDMIRMLDEQIANLHVTGASLSAHDDDDAANHDVKMEGSVHIGSVKEWKPRYVVLNEEALVVTRVKEDKRSQRLALDTITNVTVAEAGAGSEHVLMVALNTGFTVWIKAAHDEERDTWIRAILAAKAAKK